MHVLEVGVQGDKLCEARWSPKNRTHLKEKVQLNKSDSGTGQRSEDW